MAKIHLIKNGLTVLRTLTLNILFLTLSLNAFAYKETFNPHTNKLDKVGVDQATDINSSICSDGEILKKASGVWACGADDGGAGSGDNVTSNGTAIDTTANFIDSIYTDMVLTDGGAGGPDTIAVKPNYNAASGDLGLATTEVAFAANGFVAEGTTADTIEMYFAIPDPAVSDKTITFPNATDTLVGKDTTDTLTNKTLAAADNVIDADTAVALAANGANASAGSAILGVDASGAAEGAFDVLTQAELIDEDDMVSDSAVRPPSQQSVKAYVDAGLTTEAEIEAVVDLQDLQGAVTDGQVPNNITVDLATLASTVTVVDSTDATSSVAIFDSATGSLAVKTDAGLTYDASNGTLTATRLGATTVSGNATLDENVSIALDPAGSADGKYSGITVSGTAGAALAFGDVIYLAVADSRWELADADASSTSGGVLMGICVLAAAADGDPTTILLKGLIRADAAFPALTIGAPVYVSTTAGDVQVAQPSGTDDVIQVLGFAMTADEMYFNPSNDYITHT